MEIKKLENRSEFEEWQAFCQRRVAAQKRRIYVCCGTVCLSEGAMKIYARLKELLQEKHIQCEVELATHLETDSAILKKTGCHGLCNNGPMIRIDPEGWLYTKVRVEDVEEIIEKSVIQGKYISRLGFDDGTIITKRQRDVSFFKAQTRRVLKNCGEIDAENLEETIAVGEYSALQKVLFDLSPNEVLETIRASGLRGRGGFGASAWEKWKKASEDTDPEKVLLVNDGQLDVGSFMDRGIIEGDPHKVVEGMAIVGIACGITEGYAYVHPQYQVAEFRLRKAVEQAEMAGLLGDNILGSGKTFHLHVNSGMKEVPEEKLLRMTAESVTENKKTWFAHNYINTAGEMKPATLSNNVETIVNVPDIIENGVDWFRSCGTEESPGTKVFMLTGAVNNIGMIEIPFGFTVRQVVENIGGGMLDGAPFRAVRVGGRVLLLRENMDFPIAFETLEELGEKMGPGGLEVMDGKTSMMETAKYLLRFAARGSCGRCTPCREGMPRMTALLEKLARGEGTREDMAEVTELAQLIQTSALCFETCTGLGTYRIDETLCIGCTKCARNCPAGAISGSLKHPHEIDQTKCIKCGTCLRGCPKHAVKEDNPWKTNT